jgi:hypothetical protein
MESDEHSPKPKIKIQGIIAVDPYFWGLNELLIHKQVSRLRQKPPTKTPGHLLACSPNKTAVTRPRRWEVRVHSKPAYQRAWERFSFLIN